MKKNTRPTIASLYKQVEELNKNHRTILSNVARGFKCSMELDKARDERIDELQTKLDKILPPPALQVEAPKFKVGDLVVCLPSAQYEPSRGLTMPVLDVDRSITGYVGMQMPDGTRTSTLRLNIRHCTPAEIQAYREAEEAKRKQEEWAKKQARIQELEKELAELRA
jgi:hypothetical protein